MVPNPTSPSFSGRCPTTSGWRLGASAATATKETRGRSYSVGEFEASTVIGNEATAGSQGANGAESPSASASASSTTSSSSSWTNPPPALTPQTPSWSSRSSREVAARVPPDCVYPPQAKRV
ncbi:hypothetical protein Fmac_022856 [Flemingia macrophylla]|uniref:Uncharacterized protein n=1 Tax=Flemingia macrophylla TaxID=520843 RepID=A0ABD1LK22_9FABA